ncbi:Aamy domain-containing protein, partial [Meloidogyne graminicola]
MKGKGIINNSTTTKSNIGFFLLFAILLIISHPKCEFSIKEWWKDSIIYEIWTISFFDSNSDGIGDIIGIIHKLDYLKRIGVGAIFLRSIIRVESSGIGVIEYKKLSSNIGTFEHFNELIKKAHSKGIRILIDFPLVLNSISNPWFKKSALASANPEDANFADFYIWRRGIPNSEFISEYSGSILKYFHAKNRPDLPVLAWSNKNVSDTIKKALSFWINEGIDGFHFSSIEYLHRSEDGKTPEWESIAKILRSLRIFIDDEKGNIGEKIFIFASYAHLSESTKRLLIEYASLNLIVNTELQSLVSGNLICSKTKINSDFSIGECVNEIVADLLMFHKKDEEEISSTTGLIKENNNQIKVWPVWSIGNSFTSRLASRVDSRIIAEMLIQLILILPGTPLLYYGEEISQKDESRGRFPQRGPLLDWNIEEEIKNNFTNQNLSKKQLKNFNKISQNIFRNFLRLINLRKYSNSLRYGNVYITKPMENDAFLITIFAVNFGLNTRILPITHLFSIFNTKQQQQKFKWYGRIISNNINSNLNYPINSFLDLTKNKIIKLESMQSIKI